MSRFAAVATTGSLANRRAEVANVDYTSFPGVDVFRETGFATREDGWGLLARQSHQRGRWADILFIETDADTISAMFVGQHMTPSGALSAAGIPQKM